MRLSELELIESQLFKKNEELMINKATLELTLREMELSKNDCESVKNHYNILQS